MAPSPSKPSRPPATHFPFLDLSAELRLEVYNWFFLDGTDLDTLRNRARILEVSHGIRDEAMKSFCARLHAIEKDLVVGYKLLLAGIVNDTSVEKFTARMIIASHAADNIKQFKLYLGGMVDMMAREKFPVAKWHEGIERRTGASMLLEDEEKEEREESDGTEFEKMIRDALLDAAQCEFFEDA